MAKCIVCNRTFELSEADKEHYAFHDPAFCSVGCAAKYLKRPVMPSDRWNIHVGPVDDKPPEAGRESGVVACTHCFGPKSKKFSRKIRSSWIKCKKHSRP